MIGLIPRTRPQRPEPTFPDMSRKPRLLSLDALRGADMFWIIGGHALIGALAVASEWPLLAWVNEQCVHVEWHGFRFYDLIFPLFLFLAGVSMPMSFATRQELGASRWDLTRHAARRGAILVILGMVYNGLLSFDLASLRVASVLGRIGLAWMCAAFIVIWCTKRAQVMVLFGLLLGYWAALTLIPVPDTGVASLAPGETLADWFDRQFMPGRLYRGDRDPEGLFSTLPAIGTALAGVLAGRWLSREDVSGPRRTLGLLIAGVACLALGGLWDTVFPINKNLWTSSFVAWCAGWSMLFLGVFYWVIDVRGWNRWCMPLVVIGANSITIYLLAGFIDFAALTGLMLERATPGRLHPAFLPLGVLTMEWALLRWMYRRGIFLKV
jgi:predicted acyltransferase